jgi:glycosyl transferase family 87
MKIKKEKGLFLLVAVGVVLSYAGFFWQQKQSLLGGASDFSTFYAAGKIVLSGDAPHVYDYATQRRAQQEFIRNVSFRKGPLLFVHAPFELIIFAPLAFFPYDIAVVLWYGINVCILVALPFILHAKVNLWLPWMMLGIAFFPPVIVAILQGQTSILLLLLLTLAFLDFRERREFRAGAVLALTTFKPHLALLLIVVLVLARRSKVLVGFFLASLALLGVSIAMVGWRATIGFPRVLVEFNRLPLDVAGVYPERMANVRGFINALLHSRAPETVLQVLIIAISALLVALVLASCVVERDRLSDVKFSLVISVTLLVAYVIHIHDLALLLLPYCLVTDYIASRKLTVTRVALAAGMITSYLIPVFELNAQLLFLAILTFAISAFAEISVVSRIDNRTAVPGEIA